MSDLRVRLIERLCQLPEAALPQVAECFDGLEAPQVVAGPKPMSDVSIATTDWPHAPVHRLTETGTFMVTGATHYKQHLFVDEPRLDLLQNALLKQAKDYEVELEAWAVFSNHYHFVGYTTGSMNHIREMISHLHSETATELNVLDKQPARAVWFNFWDSGITFEKSYLARLNYVHQNPVRHGLVKVANQYRWCSAAWFERTATPAQIKTVYSFKTDTVKVRDDYEPLMPLEK